MKAEDIVNMLRDAQFSDYESRCYVTLFQHKKLTAKECAEISKIPPTKVHETLNSLSKKGLINIIEGNPKIFSAVPLGEGLENYFVTKQTKIDSLKNSLISSLSSLTGIESEEKLEDKVRLVYGTENQYQISIKMNETAKKEILVITGVSVKFTPYKLFQVARQAIKGGVKIKMIFTRIKGREKDIKMYKEMGYQLKSINLGNIYLVVKDREESMIILVDPLDEGNRIAIHITQPELAKAHATYFYDMWKIAREI